jgi:RNA-binding protein
MSLSNRQVRHLRGLTHSLQPVVIVADKGLSENVMAEIEAALDHHELVKIKLKSDRETRTGWIREIAERCHAEKVHVIGQVACFFRRNSKKPVIELPA